MYRTVRSTKTFFKDHRNARYAFCVAKGKEMRNEEAGNGNDPKLVPFPFLLQLHVVHEHQTASSDASKLNLDRLYNDSIVQIFDQNQYMREEKVCLRSLAT